MPWTWRAYDLATGAATTDLSLANWSHEDSLKDAGAFSATLAPPDTDDPARAALIKQLAVDSTLAGRSTIVPSRNGALLGYCGVVWAPDPPSLAGKSLLSYFDDQTYDTTSTWVAVDQHEMMADLVNWVQGNGGNVQVDTSQVGASGVLRDQTWHIWEGKNVGEAFRQKADNLNGFDFDFRVEDVGGVPVRRLRMWTPRRGRPYIPQVSPVFTVGGNALLIPPAPVNGSEMATHVVALGAETGAVVTLGDAEVRVRLRATSTRTDLLAAGYPRLVHKLDRSDVKELATLQQLADGWAYYHGAAAVDEIVLEVDPNDRTWPWGSWELGDDCMVVEPAGVDGWRPFGFSDVRRVVAHRWRVDGRGERLEVVTGRVLA